MADFLSLLLGIPSLISNFNGSTTSPYQKQQEQLAAQQAQYAQALANPQSQMYQQTYNKYQDQNKANLAQVIAEAQGQNRLASSMGRTPLFSQGRGGETLFRSLMQGYQNSGAQSDQQTRGALKDAAGVGQQAQNQYEYITPNTARANTAQLEGYKGIYNLLSPQQGGGGGYLQDGAPMQQGNITWNTPRRDPNSSLFSGLF